MITVPMRVVAQLRAIEACRAQPVTARRQVLIQSHATVLSFLRIAGDEATPHAIGHMRPGQPPHVVAVAEPRNRDGFSILIHRALGWLPRYMKDVRDDLAAGFPQLIVPSESTAHALELLADRLRSAKGHAHLRRIGRYLSYFTQRRHEPGQLALLSATEIIATHWAIGQDPASGEHLAAALTWLDPPADRPIFEAVVAAEGEIMGVNTNPEFDLKELYPLLDYYRDVRERRGSAAELRTAGGHIRQSLLPLVVHQLERVEQTLGILAGASLTRHPDLPVVASLERDEFLYFMDQRENHRRITRTDRPRAAAMRLTTRMRAAEQVDAALKQGDPVARAEAVLAGRIISGVVRNPVRQHLGPWRFASRFELQTAQSLVRAREGDVLVDMSDARRRVRIVDVRRTSGGTDLSFEMIKGMKSPGLPTDGDVLDLAERVADWDEIVRHRQHIAKVLNPLPRTHSGVPLTGRAPIQSPADILTLVESLR